MLEPKVIPANVGDAKATLYYGQHVLDTLRQLPSESVQTICTSPPYWALRDYKTDPIIFGGDPTCEHQWGQEQEIKRGAGGERDYGSSDGGVGRGPAPKLPPHTTCLKCAAWRGQLGLEPTPEAFVQHLVEIFREARRVLRKDGVLWLNLGDSYAANRTYQAPSTKGGPKHGLAQGVDGFGMAVPEGLKPKDLVGIPWMTAFALRSDGWYLRSEIIWAKGNCMPESVRDRCTKSHETVFMLTKSERYFFDQDAIREPHTSEATVIPWQEREYDQTFLPDFDQQNPGQFGNVKGRPKGVAGFHTAGRNRRTVWAINPKPYPGSHFAVWPEELVEPMILAGTSTRGCCPKCLAPWERVTEKPQLPDVDHAEFQGKLSDTDKNFSGRRTSNNAKAWRDLGMPHDNPFPATVTTSWQPTCDCNEPDRTRCTVMDIFSGSGTTGLVALRLGRDYIGLDLNTDYLPLAECRILGEEAPIAVPAEDDEDDLCTLFAQ